MPPFVCQSDRSPSDHLALPLPRSKILPSLSTGYVTTPLPLHFLHYFHPARMVGGICAIRASHELASVVASMPVVRQYAAMRHAARSRNRNWVDTRLGDGKDGTHETRKREDIRPCRARSNCMYLYFHLLPLRHSGEWGLVVGVVECLCLVLD